MKTKELNYFPGQKKGAIHIFIKKPDEDQYAQLSFDLELDESSTSN